MGCFYLNHLHVKGVPCAGCGVWSCCSPFLMLAAPAELSLIHIIAYPTQPCVPLRRGGLHGQMFRAQFGGMPRRRPQTHQQQQQQAGRRAEPERPHQAVLGALVQFLPVILLLLFSLFSSECAGNKGGGEAGVEIWRAVTGTLRGLTRRCWERWCPSCLSS